MTTEAKTDGRLGGVALTAALVVVAFWLGMLVWLAAHSDASEIAWARWLTVLASLEAVAFAAAGAVFGNAVQRQRVAEAKERVADAQGRADRAEQESKGNAKDAANGRTLAAAVKMRLAKAAAAGGEQGEGYERLSAGRSQAAGEELVALAQRLFPD